MAIMYPTMGTIVGLKAFTAAILGGIGSIPGAMLGGFLLGLLEVFRDRPAAGAVRRRARAPIIATSSPSSCWSRC